MLKDYLKSPKYYYEKHVAHSIVPTPTPSLKIGSVVDAILSGESIPYHVAVLKSEDPDLYKMQKGEPKDRFMSKSDMQKAKKMAQSVQEMKFWKEPQGTRILQSVLEGVMCGVLVCGKPDVLEFWVADDELHIAVLDIKTAAMGNTRNTFTWHHTCKEWGYYHQLAMYRQLVFKNVSEGKVIPGSILYKKIVWHFGHIVIASDRDGYVRVQLFRIAESQLTEPLAELEKALQGIRSGVFVDPELSWDTAPFTGDIQGIAPGIPGMELATDEEESEEKSSY